MQAYRSQLPLLRGLMDSFVRANELFAPVDNVELPVAVTGDPLNPSTWTDANGNPIPPVERDPVGDFLVRSAVPGSDLVAAFLTRGTSNTLWMCSQARDEISVGLTHRLRLKALDGKGVITYEARSGEIQTGWKRASQSGVNTCAEVSLADLGNPWAVYLGTEVEGGGRLIDQTGWQLVNVNPVH